LGNSPRILFAVLSALALPACGGGGEDAGSGPPVTTLTAFVSTPVAVQHSTATIRYTLADPESDSVTILVEFSKDGGSTWAVARPDSSTSTLTGLTSSPAGTPHTFRWNTWENNAASTAGPVNPRVRIRITPSDAAVGVPGSTADFSVDLRYARPVATATALFPWSRTELGKQETPIGNLVADAMRLRFGAQLCLQNGWGVTDGLTSLYAPADMSLRRNAAGYAAGPPYDLVAGDGFRIASFPNRVVTRTITGTLLYAVLEFGVGPHPSKFNGFPQISGFSFTFKAGNPAGSRILSVTLDGGTSIAKDATVYTFVTNDYVNTGGDGYGMLNTGVGTSHETMGQIVAVYIETLGVLTPAMGRITVVPWRCPPMPWYAARR